MSVIQKLLFLFFICAVTGYCQAQESNHYITDLRKEFPVVFSPNLFMPLNGLSDGQNPTINANSSYARSVFLMSSLNHKPTVQKYQAPNDWKFKPIEISKGMQAFNALLGATASFLANPKP